MLYGTIVKLTNLRYANENENKIQLTGLKWIPKRLIFNYPTSSAHLGMWQLNTKYQEILFNSDYNIYLKK